MKLIKKLISNYKQTQSIYKEYENMRAPLRSKDDYYQATESNQKGFSNPNSKQDERTYISSFSGATQYVWNGRFLSEYSGKRLIEFDGSHIKKYAGSHIYKWENNCLSAFAGKKLYTVSSGSISRFAANKIYSYDSKGLSKFAGPQLYSIKGSEVPVAIMIVIAEKLI
ncbi:hypothetical protein EZV73_26095 [Acidaminobacter sp. JC074]|uniref:hypothetical protein n=1 Tax=Acidaminobacter sp. JC074 TaxID=2530199 RepID=UPI001F0DBC79|nr:hypothetical protein [Acidaminobacter sp. JC074]MCH4891077.1 hypothetical protein [Acidaminobacter sp. JC074]